MIQTPAGLSKLGQRVGTSIVLLGAVALTLFYAPAFAFGALITLFSVLALSEFFGLLRQRGIPVYRLFGLSMGAIIPIIVIVGLGFTQSGEVLFLVLGCLFLFVLQFFRQDNDQALVGISLTLFGILYISWFLSFVIKVRYLPGGVFWAAYLILVTKAADIGAYLIGTLFGRHSLIPHISPKKSVEGFWGGVFFSMGVSLLAAPYAPLHFTTLHWVVLGGLMAVIGQIGDLSESLMKRFCNAKDSGSALPGMGGFFDAIDSILFTAPIFYYHLKIYL